MPLKTPREWAETYEAAINAIVSGEVSSYSLGGRTFSMLDLQRLEEGHRYWLGRLAEIDSGFVTYSDQRRESYEAETL